MKAQYLVSLIILGVTRLAVPQSPRPMEFKIEDILQNVKDMQAKVTAIEDGMLHMKQDLSKVIASNEDINQKLIRPPRDCFDLYLDGQTRSGIYTIYPDYQKCNKGVDVWCDMGEEGEGGWTVVLLRQPLEDQVDFNQTWNHYSNGFGSPDTEYWIGNENLFALTNGEAQKLRLDMTDWDGESRFQEYNYFVIEPGYNKYRLHLGKGSGTAGNAMAFHDNLLFSTPDQDNDRDEDRHCGKLYSAGFWFLKCYLVGATTPFKPKEKDSWGLTYHTFHQDWTSLMKMTFKIKPASDTPSCLRARPWATVSSTHSPGGFSLPNIFGLV